MTELLNTIHKLCPIAEETNCNLSELEFNSRYAYCRIPVVFKNAFPGWGDAFGLWNEGFFRSRFGNVQGRAGREIDKSINDSKIFTLSEYFDYMHETGDESPYYLRSQFHVNSYLRQHYAKPAYFHCWYSSLPAERRKYDLSWIYFGAKNTCSKLHTDIWNTSAWNALISGKKLWMFFGPSQDDFLYKGKVDVFSPDYNAYPLYRFASPLVCIQNPGDVVYTPCCYRHCVVNLEAGVSLTENFINITNYRDVLEQFRCGNRPKSFNSFLELVKSNLKTTAYEYA